MQKVLFVVAISALGLGALADRAAVDLSIVERVNSAATTWTAHANPHWDGWTIDGVKRLLGAKVKPHDPSVARPLRELPAGIPENFDGHLAWPEGCIGYVRDQGRCGSCWIFGAVESMSDRICIASNGSTLVNISAYDELTCNGGGGCEGGEAEEAFDYAVREGVVDEGCAPYLCPNNQDNGHCVLTCTVEQQPCLNFVNTPSCKKTCQNGAVWKNSKHFMTKYYDLNSNKIEQEIMTHGPVAAAFTVYEDFLSYKSGVYQHTTGDALGGHVIKIIGFGTTADGTKYWQCQNSWTTYWGDGGYFQILRGSDECGIEDDVSAAIPKL
eukprot:TRINITY_DN22482_c0_g1_i1.p1 TRINITY_DN22482_c0_g1~~TRINITY_DN22482_c0_g1_i1.p1  ORF type:complete len:326 (-),score=86.12 TRINITY_DN22482_c0_g1_i1:238-1215(-)